MKIEQTIANRHRGLTREWHAITDRLPRTLAAIAQAATLHDGYPSTASGADTGPHGHSDTSSTERAVLHRLHEPDDPKKRPGPIVDAWQIDDFLQSIETALRNIHAICDRHTQPLTPADLERLRCIGTGDHEGASCTQYADPNRRDGRCTRCGPTHDRTQKANYDRRRYHARTGSLSE